MVPGFYLGITFDMYLHVKTVYWVSLDTIWRIGSFAF